MEKEKIGRVRCLECARKKSRELKGFVCYEECKIGVLMRDYDSFVLPNNVSIN